MLQLLQKITARFASLLQVFADPDLESVRRKSEFISLMFVVIGCVSFVTMFFQVSVFLACVFNAG